MVRPSEPNVVEKVCALYGGQSEVARRLEVSQQRVSQWVQRGRFPKSFAKRVEDMTLGEVKAREASPIYEEKQ